MLPPNRTLYTGDNLPILRGLESASCDLVYLDPPFNSNRNYAAALGSPAAGAAFKDAWRAEDTEPAWWGELCQRHEGVYRVIAAVGAAGGAGERAYLIFMALRLLELRRLLKPGGSLYLHCDSAMSHPLKLVLDVLFGAQQFRAEIIWRIGWVSGFKSQRRGWIRNHDTILYYTNSDSFIFNKEYLPYPAGYRRRDGKPPAGKGIPIEDTWNCYAPDALDSIQIKSFSREKTGYPTQKPLALLERIIRASSPEGGLVLDPFCGCATTCIAAERLGRRWLGIDLAPQAARLLRLRAGRELEGPLPLHHRTQPPRPAAPSPGPNGLYALYGRQQGACGGCGEPFLLRQLTLVRGGCGASGGMAVQGPLQLLCAACQPRPAAASMAGGRRQRGRARLLRPA